MATEKLRYIVSADASGFKNTMKAIGAAVTAAFIAAMKITMEFEAQMSKVEAVSGATADELKALEREARRLGAATAYSASEVAQLEFELAKLGFTTNEILNSAGGILALAAALGVDLASAATLAGSSIRAFGLDTAETGRVVDVLTKATTSSALDFTKLTESLKDAAPIAKLFNFSIEETVAILAVLANRGIHGSKAGVALRGIFLELNKKGLSLNDAFKLINDSSDKAGTAMELVGKRFAPVLTILASATEETDKLTDALINSEGAAKKVQEQMEDNLEGDLKKMKSAMSEIAIAIGQELTPAFRTLVQDFTDFLTTGGVAEWLLDFVDTAIILVQGLRIVFLRLAEAVNMVSWALLKITPGDWSERLGEVGDNIMDIQRQIREANESIDYRWDKDNSFKRGENRTPNRTPGSKGKNTLGRSGGVSRPKITGVKTGITGTGIMVNNMPSAPDLAGDLVKNQVFSKLDEFITKLQETEKNSIRVAESIGDAFTTMGSNISMALTDSMGMFGAFLGAFIETSLQMIGQSLQESLIVAAQEKTKTTAKAAGAAARSAIAAGETAVSLTASAAIATGNAIEGATETAKSTGPAAAFVLPGLIAGAVALVGSAFSGLGRGGSGASVRNTSATMKATPFSATPLEQHQGRGGTPQLVATVRGQDLRFALQNANAVYGQTS